MSSKIGTGEWFILIFGTLALDGVQFALDLVAVGIIINRFIDAAVGFGLPAYFWWRGVKMNASRGLAYGGGFILEEIGLGGDDGLPLWTLEVAVVWLTVYLEKRATGNPAAQNTADTAYAINQAQTPFNESGRREPMIEDGSYNTSSGPAIVDGVRAPGGGLNAN